MKIIIIKKFVYPEVYDIVDKSITEKMITCYSLNIQNICKNVKIK